MPDLVTRFVELLIPGVIAFGASWISSKVWVKISPTGAVGIYFILMSVVGHFEGESAMPFAILYGVATTVGLVMLVGDVGGRFGRRARAT